MNRNTPNDGKDSPRRPELHWRCAIISARSLAEQIAEDGIEAGQLDRGLSATEVAARLDSGRGNFCPHHLSAASSRVVRRIRPPRRRTAGEDRASGRSNGRPRGCSRRPRKVFTSIRRAFPEADSPNEWFQRLFVAEPQNFSLRPYDEEQWDVMFFVRAGWR